MDNQDELRQKYLEQQEDRGVQPGNSGKIYNSPTQAVPISDSSIPTPKSETNWTLISVIVIGVILIALLILFGTKILKAVKAQK